MLPATKRSFPSSWKEVLEMEDVEAPRTMLVEDPNAPRYMREDVESILNQNGASVAFEAPRTRLVVFVLGRTKSFVDEYDQSSDPVLRRRPSRRHRRSPTSSSRSQGLLYCSRSA